MTPINRFSAAAVVSGLLAALAYVAFVHTATGQSIENLALRGARQELEFVEQEALLELSGISMAAFAIAIAVVMAIALLRRKPRLAVTAALIMGSSVVIAEIAKHLLPRPELVEAPPGWLHNSAPSGHVTIAVAIGIGAIIVAPYAFRWLVTIAAAFYAAGISMDVATAGWHRLSGAISATLLVIAVACVGLVVLARLGRVAPFPDRRLLGAIVATVVLGITAVGIGGVGLVFGYARLLPIPEQPTPDQAMLAYSSTLLAAFGVITAAVLVFLWLIRPYGIDERVGTREPMAADPSAEAVTTTR